MRKFITLSVFIFTWQTCLGQVFDFQNKIDSLHRENSIAIADTSKVIFWSELASYYKFSRPDSGIYYGTKALLLARSISFIRGELNALHHLALSYNTLGNESKSLKINLECLKISQENNIKNFEGFSLLNLGFAYYNSGEFNKALDNYRRAYFLFKLIEQPAFVILAGSAIGSTFMAINEVDSALLYCLRAKNQAESINTVWVKHLPYSRLAKVHRDMKNADSALFYFRKSYDFSYGIKSGKSYSALEMAKLFENAGKMDSSIFYANEALEIALNNNLYSDIVKASSFFSEVYEKNDPIKALTYTKIALAYTDSLTKLSKMTSFSDVLDFDEQQRQYELETAQKEFQSRLRTNIFLGSTFTLIVIAFFLFRNSRQKQKAKQKIEKAYDLLKSTQTQLIQSEKMASLGELTAGIAHEIQNPLNFVNNFSEVSEELITELKEELEKGEVEEAKVISNDVIQNLQKINHHGQRASSIVKGMLEHSRSSDKKKALTDINKLADEYLRLAYHGLRANDKSFKSDFKTEFDESLPKINVIPQDFGRVFLNLINNAFFAVDKRSKEGIDGYKPVVIISTKKHSKSIEISVKDNGAGIPADIKDKIFQPFFTTKPTGQGTGLGLSLSYDIMKVHGGEILVDSEAGEGTTFKLTIPTNP